MRHLLAIPLAAILLVSPATEAPVDYFPPGILDEISRSSKFREHWYSENLTALKEPSLWELSKTQKSQTYRFLWLRSFNRPISVRLDINADGSSIVTAKAANGHGGSNPGKLVMKKTRVLTKQDTDYVLDRFKELGFWDLPTHEKPQVSIGADGEEYAQINLEGAQWILEGVKDGNYHIVDRWSPENGATRTLGILLLINIANLKLLYEEVY